MFSSRIRLKPLASLCHRLAIATNAGLEDRRIWRDEATRGGGSQQRHLGAVAEQLAAGATLPDALRASGDYLPPLFRQMAEVGDATGHLDRTYKQLAQHYDRTLQTQREFKGRLAWPLIQLGMAAAVVGLVIWIMGMLPINQGSGDPSFDLLGLGLIGTRGLIVYVNFLILIGIGVLLFIEASRRGLLWTRRLQHLAVRIPVIGGALKTLALSKFTWALQLVFDTPMDLRRALPLALEATGNDYYAEHGTEVAARIQTGADIHDALAATEVFPRELLDSIAVGEQSGMLAETMRRQAEEYRERAAAALSLLAQLLGYAVWLCVAILIIVLIFRFASVSLGILDDASKM